MFNDFCFGIVSAGMGPPMASWLDLLGFAAATQQPLEPWEAKALMRLSYRRAVVLSEQKPSAKNPGG